MELIVFFGLLSVIYGGYETWINIKPSLVICAIESRKVFHILSATLKSTIRNTIKHLYQPSYRHTKSFCVHSHKINSFNHARHL